jgi:protein tyrosine kinase modulator
MNMLQKVDFEDDVQGLDRGHMLRPAFYWELVQRRWLYFVIPFVLIASGGIATSRLLPAVYLSEGKILVESQQIPMDLVRPTVTSAAQERIQVIEQRTMTRDNLIAIADKFDLFPEKRRFMSVSEVVELMKKSAKIAPVDTQLDFKQTSRNPTIVFSVGFEYSNPQAATQVANELMTRILNEDLRDRNSRATDTTKFLAREVQKLQTDSDALDTKIAQIKLAQLKAAQEKVVSKPDQQTTMLGQLKVEFAQKSALYSEKHPILQSLKRQIAAMEREISASAKDTPSPVNEDATAAANLEALETQQETLQKNLDAAQTKLATARIGESLERNQQSEKLQIIEQPTAPQDPVKPNRPKIAGLAVLLAAAAGAGLAFVAELADKAIRRSSDIFAVVDSRLVVSIPYITTLQELRHRKRRVVLIIVVLAALVVGATIAAFLILPVDLMITKARVGLFR